MNQGWLAAVGGEDGHASDKKKLDQLPERFINRYVLVLTIALMTVRGLGFLAVVVYSSPPWRLRHIAGKAGFLVHHVD